jgi:hypothetical protein
MRKTLDRITAVVEAKCELPPRMSRGGSHRGECPQPIPKIGIHSPKSQIPHWRKPSFHTGLTS